MYIASSTVRPYPVTVPVTQAPLISSGAAADVVAGQNAQPQAPNAIPNLSDRSSNDTSRTLLLARRGAGEVTFAGRSATDVVRASLAAEGLVGRDSQRSALNTVLTPAQRAVAEYTSVATQQHREELVAVFGLDEFA